MQATVSVIRLGILRLAIIAKMLFNRRLHFVFVVFAMEFQSSNNSSRLSNDIHARGLEFGDFFDCELMGLHNIDR